MWEYPPFLHEQAHTHAPTLMTHLLGTSSWETHRQHPPPVGPGHSGRPLLRVPGAADPHPHLQRPPEGRHHVHVRRPDTALRHGLRLCLQ